MRLKNDGFGVNVDTYVHAEVACGLRWEFYTYIEPNDLHLKVLGIRSSFECQAVVKAKYEFREICTLTLTSDMNHVEHFDMIE